MKRLTVDVYALHYVLYLCTLNKSKLTGAAEYLNKSKPSRDKYLNVMWKWYNISLVVKSDVLQ